MLQRSKYIAFTWAIQLKVILYMQRERGKRGCNYVTGHIGAPQVVLCANSLAFLRRLSELDDVVILSK